MMSIENDNINTDEMAAFIPRPYVIGGYNGHFYYGAGLPIITSLPK
ncbi:15070_t:CDS:2, partial [Entrophospora sp. SA101]